MNLNLLHLIHEAKPNTQAQSKQAKAYHFCTKYIINKYTLQSH